MNLRTKTGIFLWLMLAGIQLATAASLESIRVSENGKGFVTAAGAPFVIWGVNYDHDENKRLIENYWMDEWATVVADFREIKALGANTVRIHLQTAAFMEAPDRVNTGNLEQLKRLVQLAEQTGLYLDLTGLGCYHKQDVPGWYDAMDEAARWNVQSCFWEAVAQVCAGSDAVFCYDLMNEPIIGGSGDPNDWTPGEFGGSHFVQRLTLDPAGRTQKQIAQAWVQQMAAAIRKYDTRHLITVGAIPWVYTFPTAKPLFYSKEVSGPLDFVSVHFYPESGKIDWALEALNAYQIGKPLVIEEMFPLKCSIPELNQFIDRSKPVTSGWVGFYWGKTIDEYAQESSDLASAVKKSWLEYFRTKSMEINLK